MDRSYYISANDWDTAFGSTNYVVSSEYKCPFCGIIIRKSKNLSWINERERSFKCPGCQEKLFWL